MHKILLLLLSLTPIFASIQDVNTTCKGTANTNPLIDVPPKLVDSVPNGKKYVIQPTDNTTSLTIVTLNGSWYNMGYAYGQLMKEEINDGVQGMFDYVANQTDWNALIQANLPFYLKWIPNLLSLNSSAVLMAVLSLQHELTLPFTPQRFTDQLKGISDGSGIDLTLLTNMNLFPEFAKAHCSMIGAWGSASYDGKLVQLRALDWDYQAYIVRYPTVSIYFAEEAGSNPFANLGFAGMIGAISGYSTKVAVCEKVWLPSTMDIKSNFGTPFAYLLSDILQFGNDLESAVGILFNASRTCSIYAGVGSKTDNSFEGIEMDFETLNIYNDQNFTNYTDAHPQMDGIMFWDKHVQPSTDMCMGTLLQENLGKIDPEFIYRQVTALGMTGDTQVAVYQFENDTVYLSYSDPVTGVKAYTRPLMKLDMGTLLTYETHF